MKIHLLRFYKPLTEIKKAGFLLFFYSLEGKVKKKMKYKNTKKKRHSAFLW